MNIIHATTSLAPEFGGPVRTVPALCYELAKHGHDVSLVYLDFGDAYKTIQLPSHPKLEYIPLPVKFNIGLRPIIIPEYQSVVQDLASEKKELIIHDNGIWLPYSGQLLKIANQTGAKMITSTHGMLEPWAMGFRRFRKVFGWYVYQKHRLMKNVVLHATSWEEKDNLLNLKLSLPIAVIPNGTEIPNLDEYPKSSESSMRKVLFMSRIHPKKGLLNLVEAVDILRPKNWKFLIAGYDEGGHQKDVQEAISLAGLENWFTFLGPIEDHEKWRLYRSVDLFILPTYSENFGMVIAEALAAELPVITTTGTPWKDLVEYNCGWWVEPSASAITEALREAFNLDQDQLDQMSENGRQLIERKFSWSSIAEDMIDVYSWMLDHQGMQPDTIS